MKTNQTTYFSQINVAPLTDVFLVLLVIMMLIIPLAEQTTLKVSAPGTTPGADSETPKVIAQVYESGLIKLNDRIIKPANSQTLQKELEKEQKRLGTKDIVLQISSEELATQQDVVSVLDAAVGAGVSQVAVLPPLRKK
ncbi:MAG: biopolymer transporter ExbD [Candidatus Obscuribacterales bacterium]|jgi:biopolymer transport protein ExbD/biopolymer transport protein TolR|nr:biopolymer transporter ExbD [Candidatus Obscuribacterales bacterium]